MIIRSITDENISQVVKNGKKLPLMNHWFPSLVKNLLPLIDTVGMALASPKASIKNPRTASIVDEMSE
jgi:hypothetical protein